MSKELSISTPGQFAAYLEKAKGSVAAALPKHMNPDRMLRLAVTCFSQNPALRNCDPRSIVGSIIVASQLGLEPGIAGQGYLIPYKDTCTFVPGWQGLVGLLNNTGRATAWTGSVFEGDEFQCDLGSTQKIVHRPGPNFGDASKLTWVYACGKVNGAEVPIIEAWPVARVWKHRDRFNKVGQRHYSFQHPEMYARKVVLLQVLKYLPRSIELSNALVAATAAEEGKSSRVMDGVVVEIQPETGDREAEASFLASEPAETKQDAPQTEKPASKPAPAAKASPEPSSEQGEGFTLDPTPQTDLERLRALILENGFSEEEVLAACKACKIKTADTLKATPAGTLAVLVKDFDTLRDMVEKKRKG